MTKNRKIKTVKAWAVVNHHFEAKSPYCMDISFNKERAIENLKDRSEEIIKK